MEKLTKQDLKGPDEFIKTSTVIFGFIEKNLKLLVFSVGAIGLAGFGYGANEWYQNHKEEQAVKGYFLVKKQREKIFQDFQKEQDAKVKKETAKKKLKKEKEIPQEPVFNQELAAAYRSFVEGNGTTRVGVLASIEAANYLAEHKKSDQARDILKLSTSGTAKAGLFSGLHAMTLGRIEADLGNCQSAVEQWEKVTRDSTQKTLHADSLLRSGVCYEKLKQKDQALRAYDRVIQEFSETRAAQSAKMYKRLLERT